MPAELAAIDIEFNGSVYSLKAFATMLMIMRLPDGHNLPFPREGVAASAYDEATQTWDDESIGALIEAYESDSDGTNESRPY